MSAIRAATRYRLTITVRDSQLGMTSLATESRSLIYRASPSGRAGVCQHAKALRRVSQRCMPDYRAHPPSSTPPRDPAGSGPPLPLLALAPLTAQIQIGVGNVVWTRSLDRSLHSESGPLGSRPRRHARNDGGASLRPSLTSHNNSARPPDDEANASAAIPTGRSLTFETMFEQW